jgi:hypothetical protein
MDKDPVRGGVRCPEHNKGEARGSDLPSNIFEQLLIEQIGIFKNSFSSMSKTTFYDERQGRLIHAGEFGMYREAVCRDFLKFFIPGRLEISQGFLMNAYDEVSTQCDIVVYDSDSTPLIQSESRQRFFPVETVCAVGEVKSDISQNDLKGALGKLADVKRMKEHVVAANAVWQRTPHTYDPENHLGDQLFTFLICDRFSPSYESLNMNQLYEDDVLYRHRHNIILSLQDGLLLYCFDESRRRAVPWPMVFEEGIKTELDDCSIEANSEDTHLKWFAHFMFYAMSTATILYPDLWHYMHPPSSYATGYFAEQ